MKKYICTVCGYVHEGDSAPETCPVCKAPASEFRLEAEEKKPLLGGKNSNAYIITYSVVMVVLVAAVLAFAALKLQPIQNANVELETKGAVLASIGQGAGAAEAADKNAYINDEYNKYITDAFLVNEAGERVDGNAFEVLKNIKAEYDKPAAERLLPVFVSNVDGQVRYILPVYGKGLWGPIWGYVALNSDWRTISGVVFDHKGETPGLGAEIAGEKFQSQFEGKSIFSGDELVAIAVLKGAGSSAGNPNAVDAVSGGTITSRGVQQMLLDCLSGYKAYIEQQLAVAADAANPLNAECHE